MEKTITLNTLLIPAVFIVAGFLAGWIFQKIILKKLKKVALVTKWRGDEVIISSLHGFTFFWIFLIGVYGAIRTLPLKPEYLAVSHKTLIVLVIATLTFFLSKAITGLIGTYSIEQNGAMPTTTIFNSVIRILVFSLGFLVILQSLGISITPILTALGVGGLAVALALQETLSNLFAGIHIIASKQVKPDDYIRLESGEEGYVVDISWRNTTIRTLPNNMVIVPNSKLASVIITNYESPQEEMSFLVQVGVAYDSDLEKVERVTIETGKEVLTTVTGGVTDFSPFIRYHTFDDSSINFTVILRCREFVDQYLLKHEFVKRLQKRYAEEGINIPFPIRTVIMNQGKS